MRSTADPGELARAIRREMHALAPQALVTYMRTMSEQLDESLTPERLMATLSSIFGLLALCLACVGLYGVMAYSVARRTREIGIRMALGAARDSVLRLVVRESLSLALLGSVIGIAAALAVTRLVSGLLYGVTARDPTTLAGALLVLAVVALAAAWVPALRASRVEPSVALRQE